jgi:uncharacterized protein YceH (UPF0502 family)/phospholipid N-methyltransferase
MDDSRRHADLTAHETRVLGCLIEKEATTPDAYPLTVNSLRNACNQSTSRSPVMAMSDHEVESALGSLRERGLTRTVHSTSNRATKYRHVVPDALGLDGPGTAVLSVLMLRGEQTVGELKTRTDRQHSFRSTDEVTGTLTELARRDEPLVMRQERQPGQKDARWVHLLSPVGVLDRASSNPESASSGPVVPELDPTDPYGTATAEFYELLATAHWERTGIELLDLLDGVDPSAGPIVDVGAGTGIGLPYLRAAVPDAELYAIEPSRAMRTALHTRLLLDPSLTGRVTVDPRPLAESLPERASAVVLSAVLGHLDRSERSLLWRYAAEHMPSGAPVVVEILPPYRPVVVEPTRYKSLPVGRFTYEGWQSGEPADDRTMRWVMTYRVLDGDALVSERSVTSTYRCWSPDDVRHEIEAHGLTMTEHGDAAVIRSQEPSR